VTRPRIQISWNTSVGHLVAREPTLVEVRAHADQLARGYNDPANAPLMGHTDVIDPDEVVDQYDEMLSDPSSRNFLLFCDGALVGDGDLRGIRGGTAEFAFMIAAPGHQGKGLGTKFAQMLYHFGFAELQLATIYASVVPANTASRRVFDKLGCTLDDSAAARAYADHPDDVVYARQPFAVDGVAIERLRT